MVIQRHLGYSRHEHLSSEIPFVSEWHLHHLHTPKAKHMILQTFKIVFTWKLQDAQFSIGGSSKMSAAFWYPVDGKPWHGSGHYSINCDWTSLDFYSSSSKLASSSHGGASGSSASMFALLISVISLCLSILVVYRLFRPPQNVAVEYRVLRPQNVALTSMDNNNL